MEKFNVGILGGTGMVGQQYLRLLENHPWFNVTWFAASERSAGKTYYEAVKERWHMPSDIPKAQREIIVKKIVLLFFLHLIQKLQKNLKKNMLKQEFLLFLMLQLIGILKMFQ